MDCIFCKIRDKELPAKFVYEDKDIMVFPDIRPVKKIHLLIVPKKHINDFLELEDNNLLSKMKNVIHKVVREQGLTDQGYRLIINGGGAQIIDHLHFHLTGPWGKAAAL